MPTDDRIRFATFLAPNIRPVYQAVAEYVGARLGAPTTLTVGESFAQFSSGEIDVGFICGLPYVDLRGQRPPPVELLAAPVLHGERYAGRPVYFSDVIVRRDSRYESFADLRRSSWAYNDRDSHSGYNVVRYRLVQLGATHGFFGRVVAAGYHQRAIRLVAAGEVDAAAIDSQVLAVELRDHPDLAGRLKVIDTLGPSTIQPVVAARHLPDVLKADIRAALLAMADDPDRRAALAKGLVSHFAPIADRDYDDIRGMQVLAEQVDRLGDS